MNDQKDKHPEQEFQPDLQNTQTVYGPPVSNAETERRMLEEARKFQPDLQNIQMTYGPPLGPQSSSIGFFTSGIFPMSTNQPPEGQWTCPNCHYSNTGKFCSNCGQPKEMPPEGVWVCQCGFRNTGKFCENCGSPAPVPETPVWVCACGRRNTGKYCPDCGRERPSS